MSVEKIDLALAFLQSHADAAAAILEQQPLDQVAEFLSRVPLAPASQVIQKMLPQYAARLCTVLPNSMLAALLTHIDLSYVVSIVRHSGSEPKKQLLQLLPDKTKIACRLLLNYPEDAAGAWMLTNTTTLPDNCTVEEAIARLVADKETTTVNTIYIVDRDRLIKGAVTCIGLLRATANSPINLVMHKKPEAISARTSLVSAVNYPVWNNQDTIPLVNRNHQLVGVLQHADMRKGLDQIATTITPPEDVNPVSGIFEVYCQSLVALVNTVTEVTRAGTQRRQ